MRKRVVVGLVALALVVVATAGGLFAWRWLSTSTYQEAVATMPASTLRATYTDWAQVRTLLGATSLGEGSTTRDVNGFLDDAYRADLISTSAVSGATYAMARRYGFSPLDADWEMFGQSREGAVAVMRLPESVDFGGIERNLRTLGYDPPDEGAGSGQVWAGSADLVAQIDPSLTPVQQNVVVLEDEQVVLLSDSASYASSAADVVRGSADSLADATVDATDNATGGATSGGDGDAAGAGDGVGDGAGDLAEVADEPVSAVMWASDFACEALSMASADEEDQTVADQLVSDAGGVSPLSGLVMAHQPDRGLVVGMHFESSDQAKDNLRPRTELAAGEAVGQGGEFSDRFDITTAETNGANVVLHLDPRDDEALLSDLSQGPVLFATC